MGRLWHQPSALTRDTDTHPDPPVDTPMGRMGIKIKTLLH